MFIKVAYVLPSTKVFIYFFPLNVNCQKGGMADPME